MAKSPKSSETTPSLLSAALRSRDLNLLTVLLVLLSTRSVTKAADALHLSQSALSKSLERLRREFNDPLLVRDGNRMRLTRRAEYLLPQLTASLEKIPSVFALNQSFDPAQARGHFRIGANDYFQHVLGGNLLRRVREAAPSLNLEFRSTGMLNLEQLLLEGFVDLVIGMRWNALTLRSQLLFEDRLICIVGASHPPLPPKLDRAAFCALAHLEISPTGMALQRHTIDAALAEYGQRRNVVAMCSSFSVVPEMLRASGLATVVPDRLLTLFPRGSVRVVELEVELPKYEVCLWWHNIAHADSLSRWMRDQLIDLAPKPVRGRR